MLTQWRRKEIIVGGGGGGGGGATGAAPGRVREGGTPPAQLGGMGERCNRNWHHMQRYLALIVNKINPSQ